MMVRAFLILFGTATLALADPDSAISGRIEHSDSLGTCGAVRLDTDLILTAAHCASPDRSGTSFRAGDDTATRLLDRVHRHPAHGLGSSAFDRFRFDIAVATLVAPMDSSAPVPVGAPATAGEVLTLETWRRGEASPSRTACPVIGLDDGLVTLDCAVTGGHSGAPVLRLGSGSAELVAVVVATLSVGDRPAALAVGVDRHLDTLRALAGRN